MTRYLTRRLLQAVPLLLATTLVVFFLLRATPGGPLSCTRATPA